MNDVRLGRPRLHLPRTGSTMDDLLALARVGAPEGTVVTTDFQDAGQGRAGRVWAAPPGSALLMSTLLKPGRPHAELTPLSLLVALAIATSIRDGFGLDARVKWPNDVFVGRRKAVGVLLRTHAIRGESQPVVVVGTGINVNVPAASLPETGTSIAVELGREVDRDVVRDRVLAELGDVYHRFLRGDIEADWDRLNQLLLYRDEPVSIQDGDRLLTGTLAGLDHRGGLLLMQPDATMRTVVSGDLTRGPQPIGDRSAS
ncbi:MAG TPA: biotin--[acetyl-CoA-carboxylase] ligase [Thermomicrobiales bacterium]|nr:biotin--[acetyl-CoA-carboxylase] ligase [Thermomicrobiales bacterium]